mgnify:FL=1
MATKLWNGKSDSQKINHISSLTGAKPKDVDLTGMTFDSLPKYAKMSLQDDAEDILKRKNTKT